MEKRYVRAEKFRDAMQDIQTRDKSGASANSKIT